MITLLTTSTDTASPALQALMARLEPPQLSRVARQPVETAVRTHLASLPRNRRGWPSTGFWEAASRATVAYDMENGVVEIHVKKLGVRQRALGGPIAPVNAQALAIPISPVSYGHLPREFPGLFLLATKKGAYLVQPGAEISEKTGRLKKASLRGGSHAGEKRRRAAGLNFLFKLSAGVNQRPDPAVMPPESTMQAAAHAALERSLPA